MFALAVTRINVFTEIHALRNDEHFVTLRKFS